MCTSRVYPRGAVFGPDVRARLHLGSPLCRASAAQNFIRPSFDYGGQCLACLHGPSVENPAIAEASLLRPCEPQMKSKTTSLWFGRAAAGAWFGVARRASRNAVSSAGDVVAVADGGCA